MVPTTSYDYYVFANDPAGSQGLIKKITEPDGSWHEYEYYGNGRTFRVKDQSGGVQTFAYNIVRNETRFTDERGHVETYLHQDNGLLKTQIHDDRSRLRYEWGTTGSINEFSMYSATDERGGKETFAYYAETDPAPGQLKESIDKQGVKTEYSYWTSYAAMHSHLKDLSGVIVRGANNGVTTDDVFTTYTRAVNGDGRLLTQTDGLGKVTGYDYYPANDARSGLLKSRTDPTVNSPGGAVSQVTTFDYDTAGNVKSTSVASSAAPATALATTTAIYDSFGNVRQAKDATGVTVESLYDALGRVKETGPAPDNTAIDPSDAFVTKYAYDLAGRVTEERDALGRVTRFQYDPSGNLVLVTFADGTKVSHAYDKAKNRTSTTDELGRETRFVYDNRNRLVRTIHPDGSVSRTRYDGAGGVVAQIDETGRSVETRYDAAGRIVTTLAGKQFDASGRIIAQPAALAETTLKYDYFGRLVEQIDPELNVTQQKYDQLGRVVQTQTLKNKTTAAARTTAAPTAPASGPLAALSTVEYDDAGNVRKTVVYDVSNSALASIGGNPTAHDTQANADAKLIQRTTVQYDVFDRPVKTVYADGTDTETVYDAAGRTLSTFDELNRQTVYEYQYQTAAAGAVKLGRLVKKTLPDPDGGEAEYQSPITTFVYDAVGNPTAVTDPRGFTTRSVYDARNRLVSVVDPLGGRSRTIYDKAGQALAAVDALGRATATTYDDRGRATIASDADPDGNGLNTAPRTRLEYDAAGRIKRQVDPLGTATTHDYDSFGRRIATSQTQSQVVDDGESDFAPLNGAADATVRVSSSVGFFSDYTAVTRVAGEPGDDGFANAVWTFRDLPTGTYRIYATWLSDPAQAAWLSPQVSIDGGEVERPGEHHYHEPEVNPWFGLNQRQGPNDILRFDDGLARGWEKVDDDFEIEGTENSLHTLRVYLTSDPGFAVPFHADAVRIEYVAKTEFEYDLNGNLLAEIDPRGGKTVSRYDALDRPTRSYTADPGTDLIGETRTPLVVETAYDGYGNVKSRKNGAAPQPTTGTPNPAITQTRTTTFEYDQRNRVTTQIVDDDLNPGDGVAELAIRTEYQYDDVGNRTRVLEAVGKPEARQTRTVYDDLDRVQEVFENDLAANLAEERVTVNHYDAADNLTRVEHDPHLYAHRQFETTAVYDGLGRPTSTTDRWFAAAGQPAFEEARTTRFIYDAVGNQVAAIDPLGRYATSRFDRLDRLAVATAPDPDGLAGQLPPATDRYAYDPAGNLVRHENGAGEVEQMAYDLAGRLVRRRDGRGDETLRRYDVVGNLVAQVDPAGNLTAWTYDPLNRQTSEVTVHGTRTTTYDARGNVYVTVDRNGRTMRRAYDRLDRVTDELWHQTLAEAQSSSYLSLFVGRVLSTYDGHDRLTYRQMIDRPDKVTVTDRAVASYVYDGLDRVIVERNYQPATAGAGQILSLHTLGGGNIRQVEHHYSHVNDAAFAKTERQTRFDAATTADLLEVFLDNPWSERLQQIQSDPTVGGVLSVETTVTDFDYDHAGALLESRRQIVHPSGTDTVWTLYLYDGAGRVANLSHVRQAVGQPLPTWLTSFLYAYDGANRIAQLVSNWNQAVGGLANRPLESTAYAYDDAGQLTTAASTDDLLDADYAYGPNGNRGLGTEAGGGQNVYVHAAGNRLLTTDEFGAGTDFTYVHDAEGSLLERRRTAGSVLDQRYSYDHRNRLTKAEVFSSGGVLQTTIEYRYDAAGEVVLRRETPAGNAASWEHFVTLGGQRGLTLAETGATDRPSRLYSHGPLGEVLFERTLSTAAATAGVQLDVELPLADHQLTTRAVLDGDDAGASALRVRQSVDYAPLGRVVRLRDGAGQPLVDGAGAPNLAALDVALASFHGQESDPRTGLVKMGARWYSPTTGRFTSEDPIGEGTNWYEFAGNDPVNFSDPTGLSQAGHPLAGGYSGGVTTASRIPTGAPTRAISAASYLGLGNSTSSYSSSSILGPTSGLLAPAAPTYFVDAGLSSSRSGGVNSLFAPKVDQAFADFLRPVPSSAPRQRIVDNYSQQPYDVANYGGRQYVLDPSGVNTGKELIVNQRSDGSLSYEVVRSRQAVENLSEPSSLQLGLQALPAGKVTQLTGKALANYFGREAAEYALEDVLQRTTGYNGPLVNPNKLFRGPNVGPTIGAVEQELDAYGRFITKNSPDSLPNGVRDRGPSLGQEQGREFRLEQLELYEFDQNAPRHVRGWLQNERRRVEQGRSTGSRVPPGYELGHGRTTPAREGYDYSNSKLQSTELNQLEETNRRRQGRP